MSFFFSFLLSVTRCWMCFANHFSLLGIPLRLKSRSRLRGSFRGWVLAECLTHYYYLPQCLYPLFHQSTPHLHRLFTSGG